MKSRRRRKPEGHQRLLALSLLAVLVLAAAYCAGMWYEDSRRVQARGEQTQDVGMLRRVEYEGRTYVENPAVTTVLLMGVDHESDAARYGARQGGQADFLMLLAIDHQDGVIRQLHIDRDTMAEVETVGVLGNPIGTRTMQICLAHAYGATDEENSEHMRGAVENLLEGIEIDFYLALNLDAIAALNDALGGVTVTLEDDYTAVDPAMKPGATLTLTGEQARTMVRSRMEVADGTNASRMKRQQTFLSAAAARMSERIRQDSAFINTLFDVLQGYMTTNMTRSRMAGEANQAYSYDVLPADTLAGEHTIGEDGFVEFHTEDGETARWVIDVLFEPENKTIL